MEMVAPVPSNVIAFLRTVAPESFALLPDAVALARLELPDFLWATSDPFGKPLEQVSLHELNVAWDEDNDDDVDD